MKILVAASTFPRWADDTEPAFVYQLCKRLNTEHIVHVLAPHAKGSALKEEVSGLKVHRFRYAPEKWQKITYNGGINANLAKNHFLYFLLPFFFAAQILTFIKLQRQEKYQFIHAHWIIPQGLTAIIAKFFMKGPKPKILITSHGGDLFSLQNKFSHLLKSWVLRQSDHITVVSSVMKTYIIENYGVSDKKITIAPMGVDLKNLFASQENRWKDRQGIIFVGRLVEKKGCEYLIRAFAEVEEKTQTHLTIVGDGPLQQSLINLANELLINNIEFKGAIENRNIPRLLNEHRIAVIPSIISKNGDQEGLGLTIIEAMGATCLTICSDLAAIHDIINHQKNGLLFPPKKHQELSKLITDNYYSPTSEAIALQGCKDVNNSFDWDISAHRYRSLFDKIGTTP